jgi:uncharacterized protein YqhQ
MLVSIIVFAFLQRPPLEWRIISRVALIPVIAGISYEIIRFSGQHQRDWLGRQLARPGLLLQRLTTRQPDDDQIEVAITAMETAIAADQGRAYSSRPAPVEQILEEDSEDGPAEGSSLGTGTQAPEPGDAGVPA